MRTTRLFPGPATLAAVLAALAALGPVGCARDSKPAAQPTQPADEPPPPPPLPPASGTPIGYLIDDPRLQLSDDQRTKLRAIDEDLMGKLTYLDSISRNAPTTPTGPPPKEEASRGGIGFSASGNRNDMEGGKLSSSTEGGGKGLPPEVLADNAATLKRLPEVRAFDVRKAITDALKVLSRDQQKLARTILVERGVDPDTGQFEAKGDPGAIHPESGPVRTEPTK